MSEICGSACANVAGQRPATGYATWLWCVALSRFSPSQQLAKVRWRRSALRRASGQAGTVLVGFTPPPRHSSRTRRGAAAGSSPSRRPRSCESRAGRPRRDASSSAASRSARGSASRVGRRRPASASRPRGDDARRRFPDERVVVRGARLFGKDDRIVRGGVAERALADEVDAPDSLTKLTPRSFAVDTDSAPRLASAVETSRAAASGRSVSAASSRPFIGAPPGGRTRPIESPLCEESVRAA
jgi:hypothetical protein